MYVIGLPRAVVIRTWNLELKDPKIIPKTIMESVPKKRKVTQKSVRDFFR